MAEKLRLESLERRLSEKEAELQSKEHQLQEQSQHLHHERAQFSEESQKLAEKMLKDLEDQLQEQKRETTSSLTVEKLRLQSLEKTIAEKMKNIESEESRLRAEAEKLEQEKSVFLRTKREEASFLETQKSDITRASKEEFEAYQKVREEFATAKKEEWAKIELYRIEVEAELQKKYNDKLEEEKRRIVENYEKQLEWSRKKVKSDVKKDGDVQEHRRKLSLNKYVLWSCDQRLIFSEKVLNFTKK